VLGCYLRLIRAGFRRYSPYRQAVVDHKRVLADGLLNELRRRFGGARRLVVDLEQPHEALNGLPGVLDVTVEANGLRQQLAFSADQTSAADQSRGEHHRATRRRGIGTRPVWSLTPRGKSVSDHPEKHQPGTCRAPGELSIPALGPEIRQAAGGWGVQCRFTPVNSHEHSTTL